MITMSPFIMAAKKQKIDPDIWYDWSYVRDSDKTVKLDNTGTLGDQYDATAYVCAGLEFTGTQFVDVPLEYTVGNNIIINGNFENGLTGWSIVKNNGTTTEENGRVHLTKDSSGYNFIINDASIENILYEVSGDVELVSGDLTIQGATDADINDKTISSSGSFVIGIKPQNNKLYFGIHYGNSGEFYLDNISVKPVTFQTKSLWIYDYSDNTWHITTDDQFTDVKYRIENRTIGHFFTLNTTYTQSDVDLLNANPELALNLVLGDTDTGLSFGKDDIGAYYQPDVHSGNLIQDIKTPIGNELIVNGGFDSDAEWQKQTGWRISGGYAVAENVPNDKWIYEEKLTVNKFYIGQVSIIDITNGYCNLGFGGNRSDPITDKGNYVFLARCIQAGYCGVVGYDGFSGYIDNISYREVSGIQIQNYTGDTAYTNADQQTKGIPLTKYKQDELGRIIGKADLGMGEFNGDGRYLTFPDVDLQGKSLEFVIKSKQDKIGSISISSGDGFIQLIKWEADTKMYLNAGAHWFSMSGRLPINTNTHILLIFTDNFIRSYVNDALYATYGVQEGDYPLVINDIGGSVWNPLESSLGLFKIHPKALTDAEVAEAYQQAKQLYPDLP